MIASMLCITVIPRTTNRKTQVISLCTPMIAILRQYLRFRGGGEADYLFCTETSTQLTENGLRQSIARYMSAEASKDKSVSIPSHLFPQVSD